MGCVVNGSYNLQCTLRIRDQGVVQPILGRGWVSSLIWPNIVSFEKLTEFNLTLVAGDNKKNRAFPGYSFLFLYNEVWFQTFHMKIISQSNAQNNLIFIRKVKTSFRFKANKYSNLEEVCSCRVPCFH